MALVIEQEWASFGGIQRVYNHDSVETQCRMRFAVYTPPQASNGPVPVLTYLSGLTCTWANATEKAGYQRAAAEAGVIIVAPDTSPRGDDVPDVDRYDLGSGAGFYVDATKQPWSKNYRMYSYVTRELPALISQNIPAADLSRQGLFGHSMGGHGALTMALKNPEIYRSVSAFAPITAPMRCQWGRDAFSLYLGEDESQWAGYDACSLVAARGWSREILIDQGDADAFLQDQLKPEEFQTVCNAAGVSLTLRMQKSYDHSYYFISSFMADHIAWHAKSLI